MSNLIKLVSTQKGGDGQAVKFFAKAGFSGEEFSSISIDQTRNASIVRFNRTSIYDMRTAAYPAKAYILVGIKKGGLHRVTQENIGNGTAQTILTWACSGFGWGNHYRLSGLEFGFQHGNELTCISGGDEKENAKFSVVTEKGSTLGVVGVKIVQYERVNAKTGETKNGLVDVHLYSLADPGFGWLPFPVNQTENVLLL